MKISSISAENFRGFLNHQCISFGPHVTILIGPNGFGKSTVIDALEWLLTGQLERYVGSEEGRREDYIRHVDARKDPLVEASFVVDGREVTMQRQRVSREKSELRVRSDADNSFTQTEADVFLKGMDPDVAKDSARAYVFSSDFVSYHLLGQQTIRDFVQSEPRERYEKLAPIIGVDRYVRLTEILLQTARKLGDQQVKAKEALSDQTVRVSVLRRQHDELVRSLGDDPFGGTVLSEWLMRQYAQLRERIPRALAADLPNALPSGTNELLSILEQVLPSALFWLSARDRECEQRVESLRASAREVGFLFERQGALEELRLTVKSAEGTLKALQERVREREQQVLDADAQATATSQEVEGLTKKLERITNLIQLKESLDKRSMRQQELQAEEAVLVKAVDEINVRKGDCESEVARINSELMSSQKLQLDLHRTLVSTREVATTIDSLKSEQAIVSDEMQKLEALRSEQIRVATEFGEVERELKRIEDARAEANGRLQQIAQEGQESQQLLAELRKYVQTNRCPVCSTEFESNDALLMRFDANLSAVDSRIQAATDELRSLSDKAEQLKKQGETLSSKISDLDSEVRIGTSRAARFEALLYEARQKATALGFALSSSLGDDAKLLVERVRDIEKQIQAVDLTVARLQNTLRHQRGLLESTASLLSETISKRTSVHDSSVEAQREVESLDAAFDKLARTVAIADLSPQTFAERKRELSRSKDETEVKLKKLIVDLSNARNQLEGAQREISPYINQRQDMARLEAEFLGVQAATRERLALFGLALGPEALPKIRELTEHAIQEAASLREAKKACESLRASVEAGRKSLRLDEDKATLEKAEDEEGRRKSELETIEQAQKLSRELADNIRAAGQSRTKRILSSCSALTENYYNRIYPHPLWSRLEIDVDSGTSRGGRAQLQMSARRGYVAPTSEVDVLQSSSPLNIRYGFSTGQLNLFAISLVLALAQQRRGEALPALLLDDPVQAMDDMRIAELCWVLLQSARKRQIVVATGNQNFAELMFSRSMPIQKEVSVVAHLFEGMTSQGPSIRLNWRVNGTGESIQKVA
jgi:DNA repair exonuclease SbcCD ATPase subunit